MHRGTSEDVSLELDLEPELELGEFELEPVCSRDAVEVELFGYRVTHANITWSRCRVLYCEL